MNIPVWMSNLVSLSLVFREMNIHLQVFKCLKIGHSYAALQNELVFIALLKLKNKQNHRQQKRKQKQQQQTPHKPLIIAVSV